MFSGFWGWLLVVVIVIMLRVVAVIFGAGKLPDLKVQAEEKLKLLASAAEKGKKELEAKINEAKKKREENKEENKDGEEDKPSE